MKIKELIKLEVYSVSNYDFYNFSKKFEKFNQHYYFKHIPKYAINSDFGNILETEYYHQYTISDPGLDTEEFYTIFDIEALSSLVKEEFEYDIVDHLPKIDYNFLREKCVINSLDDMHPVSSYLIIEIDYTNDDIIVDIIGVLDSDFNIQKM
jgi:hypothetical protein